MKRPSIENYHYWSASEATLLYIARDAKAAADCG